jgi:hypothetical protein
MFNKKVSKKSCQKLPQLVFGLALIMLVLVGCGNTAPTDISEAPAGSPTPEPPTATPTPEPPIPTQEPKPEETVAIEEFATDGPHTGDVAPDFALPDSNGNIVRLSDELQDNQMVVLVFYKARS